MANDPNDKIVREWAERNGMEGFLIGDLRTALNDARSIPELAALQQAHQPGAHAVVWMPMESAPRDGAMLRLLVEFDEHATEDCDGPAVTIGANNFDCDGEDRWQFAGWCWTHDHFTEGKGTPVGWLPLLSAAPPPLPEGVSEDAVERVAALLYTETTAEPWLVAGVAHTEPDRDYYRDLARRVLAAKAGGDRAG